jgi:hypothetical protein
MTKEATPSFAGTVYKLTTPHLTTRNGFQWAPGEWRETAGRGELCGRGWLHSYSSPLVAVLHNPIHADYRNFILWRGEAAGAYKNDRGLKQGHTRMRILERVEPAVFTAEQRACYAILCSLEVYRGWAAYDTAHTYKAWADRYLSGENRADAADAAYAAARAAYAADAADAAAYAADAAARAADAADAARAAYAAADAAAYAADAAARAADAADAADAAADAAEAAPIDFHALAERALKL